MMILRGAATPGDSAEHLQRWICKGLEVLWLLTIVLVPLVFFGDISGEWSSTLGSFESPKIALLRTLVALMAALWLIEWAIRTEAYPRASLPWADFLAHPALLLEKLGAWLKDQPVRWITVAVVLYSFSLLVGTIFSASPSMSLWGDLPGQDSYGAYTAITYLLLFGVIATHLKTPSQVWRLLGAVVLTGVLVAAYAILQHYGWDFLHLLEPVQAVRATSTMGNPIFAAAVLMMTIPITLAAATVSLRQPATNVAFWWILSFWGSVLAVQMLGIIFTFSRGPWGGTGVALVGFLVLTAVFVGWRPLARGAMVMALGVALTVGGIFLPLPSKGGETQVAQESRALAQKSRAVAQDRISIMFAELAAGGQLPVAGRLSSGTALYAGGLSGRIELWQISWDLMLGHPWFRFDNDGLSWARPIIGYGPDLFRTVFLLESPPTGPHLLPREAGHAHNYFVHQGVELGLAGLVTSLGVFLSIFLVGGNQLLLRKRPLPPVSKLLLIGLLAMAAGRFAEQMVGLARVSDLTIFWSLLALFAVVPVATQAASHEHDLDSRFPPRSSLSTRSISPVSRRFYFRWQLLFRLAAVACLVIGVGVLTWMKTINYIRAALITDGAAAQFRQGKVSDALATLDRAISVAPDVSTYYRRKNEINALFIGSDFFIYDKKCGFQGPGPAYEACRAEESYHQNLGWVNQRPFSFRSRFALANDAFTLARLQGDASRLAEARRLFQGLSDMAPSSYAGLDLLAEVHLKTGHPSAALKPLARSLAITKGSRYSSDAMVLQGEVYRALGQPQRAVESLTDEAVDRYPNTGEAYYIRGASYVALGQLFRGIADLTTAIHADPKHILAYNDRGQAYARLGLFELAIADFNEVVRLDPRFASGYKNSVFVSREFEELRMSIAGFDQAIKLDPQLGLAYHNRALAIAKGSRFSTHAMILQGEAYRAFGWPQRAIESLPDEAIDRNPNRSEAYYIRGSSYFKLDQFSDAIEDLSTAIRAEPGFTLAYNNRGQAYAKLGQFELAIADFNQVVRLEPLFASGYNNRGSAYREFGDLQKSIDDLKEAVRLDPQFGLAYYNIALTYALLGQVSNAEASASRALKQRFNPVRVQEFIAGLK